MKNLILIPARGGSKRIPKKNIKLFNGKPLIQWTIEAAINSSISSDICVSTDCEETKSIAAKMGVDVPFTRPEVLSSDKAKSIDVALHALSYYKDAQSIILLQPTSPLRTSKHLESFYEFITKNCAASAVSICESQHSPLWTFTLRNQILERLIHTSNSLNSRSQDLPKYYILNGAMYYSEVSTLLKSHAFINKNTIGFEMSAYSSLDIDTQFDWDIAEILGQKYLN